MYHYIEFTDFTYNIEIHNLFRFHVEETCTILQIQMSVGELWCLLRGQALRISQSLWMFGSQTISLVCANDWALHYGKLPFAFSLGGNDGVLSAATWCNPCITLGASFVLLRWPSLQLCHSPRGLCQTGPSWQGVRVDGGLRTIRDITGIQYLSWLIAGSKTKEILKSQDGVQQRRFAQEMKDLEVPPSVVTYSSAMHAWTKARLVTKTDSSWVVTIRTPVNIQ